MQSVYDLQNNHSFDYKKILIVDDNKTNILVLKSMLEDYGYKQIYSALSAKEAYSILEKESINLILLDVMMPDIDGIEACFHIRGMQKHKRTPIIMVTADDSDETLKNSFDAGANDFTTKPINFINLNTRIQNIFIHKEKDDLILNQTRSAAINDIIEVLAHQWRQPLSAISATAMNISLAYELEDLNAEKLNKYIDNITKYTKELSNTIDDISDISKADTKQVRIDINNLIKYLINMIDIGYDTNNISIKFKEQELDKVLIYSNELKTVLLNILINSQEAFIRNDILGKKIVEISTRQDDNNTYINIKDNAGGIDASHISKVFDPYFSTKYEKNAKGLGLHSCKQIIEHHHGGEITISSHNANTQVSITLLNRVKEPI